MKSKKLKKSWVRIDRNWARMKDRLWYETTENVFGMRNREKSQTPWIAINMGDKNWTVKRHVALS